MPDLKEREIKSLITQRLDEGMQLAQSSWKGLVTQSAMAYETRHKAKMDDMRKAILAYSLDNYTRTLKQSGHYTPEMIKSATENLNDVENPISMMYALISVLVPNFAYMDAVAVQPMPTQTSPIYFPQLTAAEDRNGVTKGTKLLGATGWDKNNNYTSNRYRKFDVTVTPGQKLAAAVFPFKPVLPKTVKITYFQYNSPPGVPSVTYICQDNGAGVIIGAPLDPGGTNTIDPVTGDLNLEFLANLAANDTIQAEWRYDLNSYDPAEVLYEWSTLPMTANPRRLRYTYSLDNYYSAKQVLKGYDVDKAMSQSLAGFINKEVSNGIFDNMLDFVSNTKVWSGTLPAGVSWAYHRLSILEPITQARNQIRTNIARGGGNVIVAGTKMMNLLETFDNTMVKKEKYDREPIGPYKWGTLVDTYTIVKNQDYDDAKSLMTYKADDTEASYAVGVFIGLYSPDPLTYDTLKTKRGAGTQIGETQVFDNSIVEIDITY